MPASMEGAIQPKLGWLGQALRERLKRPLGHDKTGAQLQPKDLGQKKQLSKEEIEQMRSMMGAPVGSSVRDFRVASDQASEQPTSPARRDPGLDDHETSAQVSSVVLEMMNEYRQLEKPLASAGQPGWGQGFLANIRRNMPTIATTNRTEPSPRNLGRSSEVSAALRRVLDRSLSEKRQRVVQLERVLKQKNLDEQQVMEVRQLMRQVNVDAATPTTPTSFWQRKSLSGGSGESAAAADAKAPKAAVGAAATVEDDFNVAIVLHPFEAEADWQLSVAAGEHVTVLSKMEDGWWLVARNTQESLRPTAPSFATSKQGMIPGMACCWRFLNSPSGAGGSSSGGLSRRLSSSSTHSYVNSALDKMSLKPPHRAASTGSTPGSLESDEGVWLAPPPSLSFRASRRFTSVSTDATFTAALPAAADSSAAAPPRRSSAPAACSTSKPSTGANAASLAAAAVAAERSSAEATSTATEEGGHGYTEQDLADAYAYVEKLIAAKSEVAAQAPPNFTELCQKYPDFERLVSQRAKELRAEEQGC